jgi:Uma2 family endonuclease
MEIALDLSKRYSYADYLGWLDDKRRELVDGFVKMMASARPPHQHVSLGLSTNLLRLIRHHSGQCRVYQDIDVIFTSDGSRDPVSARTVVSPDVSVICDLSKIDDLKGCWGAPDLVIEIQSPSTNHYDMDTKLHLYERHGVREYWVVQPIEHWVHVFTPNVNGLYGDGVFYESGSVPVGIFGGELISLSDIFDY